MIKQLFIPVALFALSATAASANTGDYALEHLDLGLTQSHVTALEQAREVRSTSREDAKKILQDAGIDKAKVKEVRQTIRTEVKSHFIAARTAVTNNDYAAFKDAIGDSKLSQKVENEADFGKLVQAQALYKAGNVEGAKNLLNELGINHVGVIAQHIKSHRLFGARMQTNQ